MSFYNNLPSDLDKLRELVAENEEINMKKEYETYSVLYNDVKEYIITNKLPLYGGMALNELLPKQKKFYEKYTLPDYDCFSPHAKTHAIELADFLKSKGHNYVEVKGGVHKGTYKVYAEFHPAADITQCSKHFYEFLITTAATNPVKYKRDANLVICPIVFLKWSLYMEMARPEGSIYRWEKIYGRYEVFHSTHKSVDKKLKISYLESVEDDKLLLPGMSDIIEQLVEVIKLQDMPLIGHFGVGLHLNPMKTVNLECCRMSTEKSMFEILSTNIFATFEIIKKHIKLPVGDSLTSYTRGVSKKYFKEVLPPRLRIYVERPGGIKVPILTIMEVSQECYSTQQISGFTVGTVDTILQYLYGYYITYLAFEKDKSVPDSTMKLIKSLEKYIDKYLPGIKSRFSTKCFGKQKTLLNIKKEKWAKSGFFYRP